MAAVEQSESACEQGRARRREELTSLCPCGHAVDDTGSTESDVRDRCEKGVHVVLQSIASKVQLQEGERSTFGEDGELEE
jgi:hypothetical protein